MGTRKNYFDAYDSVKKYGFKIDHNADGIWNYFGEVLNPVVKIADLKELLNMAVEIDDIQAEWYSLYLPKRVIALIEKTHIRASFCGEAFTENTKELAWVDLYDPKTKLRYPFSLQIPLSKLENRIADGWYEFKNRDELGLKAGYMKFSNKYAKFVENKE